MQTEFLQVYHSFRLLFRLGWRFGMFSSTENKAKPEDVSLVECEIVPPSTNTIYLLENALCACVCAGHSWIL